MWRAEDRDITVVVPLYNGREYVREALESVLRSARVDRVVVVDDNSSDDGPSVVAAVAASDSRVEMVAKEADRPQGVAESRNQGLSASRTPLVAFLDQDDLWLDDFAQGASAVLNENPHVSAVYGRIVFFVVQPSDAKTTYFAPRCDLHSLLGHGVIPLQCSLFRRTALDKIGGFDQAVAGADDWEVFLRLVKSGQQCRGVDRPWAGARQHSANSSLDDAWIQRVSRRVVRMHAFDHGGCARCLAAAGRTWLNSHAQEGRQYYHRYGLARSLLTRPGKLSAFALARTRWLAHP